MLLTVAYDGRPFAGFVQQPGQRTVAGELLGALQALDPKVREIRGASRTDAGVHAHGQRVAFDAEAGIPMRGWVLGTARHLPPEIAVRRAAKVPEGFVPRFQNQGKRYRYLLLRDARGYAHNSFKIDLARRTIVRALTQAARATPQSQSNKKIM